MNDSYQIKELLSELRELHEQVTNELNLLNDKICADNNNCCCIFVEGPVGCQGEQGPQGMTGEQGAQGADGPIGAEPLDISVKVSRTIDTNRFDATTVLTLIKIGAVVTCQIPSIVGTLSEPTSFTLLNTQTGQPPIPEGFRPTTSINTIISVSNPLGTDNPFAYAQFGSDGSITLKRDLNDENFIPDSFCFSAITEKWMI